MERNFKKCKVCLEEKTYDDFPLSKDGYSTMCKICFKEYRRLMRLKHIEKIRIYQKAWHRKNREKVNERQRLAYHKRKGL